jgi:outer membrane protein TolC
MNKLQKLIILVLLVSAADLPAMTLAEAVAAARAASPDAKIAEARLAAARAAKIGADSAALPRVMAGASYMQTTSPMNAFGAILNTGTFDNSIDFNSPGRMDDLALSVYLRQPIYTGGRISAGRAAARAAREAAAYEKDAALTSLDAAVVRGYFAIRQAGQSVTALEATLASYDENLRVARLREEAGQLLASERLNLEVLKARTESLLLQARQDEALARTSFAVLLGRKADFSIELAPDDPTQALIADPGETLPAHWPELEAMDARVHAASEAVRVARAGRMPEVGAYAGVDENKSWRRDGSGESWSAGVSMTMTLFDGRQTDSKIMQASAALDEAREMRRKVELSLELRLQQARINHNMALSQLEVCKRQVAQAEESARLSRERFSAGALLSAELIGVETRLADARVQLARTLASERVAMAELRLALGLSVLSNT